MLVSNGALFQDEGDTTQVSTIIHSCIGREAKYLLEHFVDMVIKLVSLLHNYMYEHVRMV